MTMAEISSSLGLPMQNITERVMDFLKTERLVEIRGGAGLSSANYQFVIIDRGSEKAQEPLARSQYIGKAPDPLSWPATGPAEAPWPGPWLPPQ